MFIYLLVEPFNSYIWDFPFFFCLSQRHRQWVPTSLSTSLMSFQAPPALCGCNWWTDPHCPAWAICLFTPTVLWQAWSGQITEQNMVFLNHKERKMSRLKVLTDSSEKRKGKQSAKKKQKKTSFATEVKNKDVCRSCFEAKVNGNVFHQRVAKRETLWSTPVENEPTTALLEPFREEFKHISLQFAAVNFTFTIII